MINKIPVIATNNGGPLEIIADMTDGLLFDRTIDDLVKKINLSTNGYNKVKNKFNKNLQMKELYKVIHES